jgi:hypothetical protein
MLLIASHATARNQTDECRKDWVFWESSHSKANVKHIHPPISNSEFKKEAEGGLDDASCCASSLLERDGNYDGKRPVYFDIRQEQTTTDKPEHDSYVVILE